MGVTLVVEKIVRVLVCNLPDCPTPEENVKRVEDTIDKVTVIMDLCAGHRRPIEELRQFAHKKGRRRGIRVTRPEDIPR